MSATNATTYYELPVFIATDKPAWLTDWNGAMNAIDTAIKEALTAGENAQTTANTATTSIATINDSLTTINTSLSTLTSTTTGLVGSVNTINSLIGNGEPTTSDKTLIGAINEIYGMITGGGGGNEIQAGNVVYDNTTSGLTADDVQSAIDELASGAGAGYDFDLTAHKGSATVTNETGITLNDTDIKFALNSDGTIGKIFGGMNAVFANLIQGDNKLATIDLPDMMTLTQAHEIFLGEVAILLASTGASDNNVKLILNFTTNKTVEIIIRSNTARTGTYAQPIALPPVLYFIAQGC